MLGDGRFDNVFNHQIKPLMNGEHDLVSQFLHQLPHTQGRTELLYQILIEPFIAMRLADGIEEDTEDNEDDTDDN